METKRVKDILPLTYQDGLIAGVIAGIVMSMWKMGVDFIIGKGLWGAPKLIATIMLGPNAYDGTGQFALMPVLVGFGLHEITSAAMGILYIPLVRAPYLQRYPVITAAVYSFIAWIIAQYFMLPVLSPTMIQNVSPAGLAIAHVVFGIAMGVATVWLMKQKNQIMQLQTYS